MKWTILDSQARRTSISAKRDAFDFDEIRSPAFDQGLVSVDLFGIELFNQSQSEDRPRFDIPNKIHAFQKALPEVAVQRTIDFLERDFVSSIDGEIKLRDRRQRFEWFRKSIDLRSVDEGQVLLEVTTYCALVTRNVWDIHESEKHVDEMRTTYRYVLLVQQLYIASYMRIHDWLADQAQSSMFWSPCFIEPFRPDFRHTLKLFDHPIVFGQSTVDNIFGLVYLPSPGGTNWIGVTSPAEYAFVCTR